MFVRFHKQETQVPTDVEISESLLDLQGPRTQVLMSELPLQVQPPIAILHVDLLTYIFELNTYTSEREDGCESLSRRPPSALDIARYTSQVCRTWRGVLLESPTIWGKLVDLKDLSRASNEWAEEVVERTGEADLEIYGPVGPPQSVSLLMSLVDKQWHRIRRLDILLLREARFEDVLWKIFWTRPAPRLEKFIIDTWGQGHSDPFSEQATREILRKSDNPHRLFAGAAPLLRRLHCAPMLYFRHSEAWVAHLSSLTVSMPFSTVDALQVLVHCSARLESLVILFTERGSGALRWSQNIHCPSLSRLEIRNTALEAHAYLSNITPAPDCALILSAESQNTEDYPMDIAKLQHMFDLVSSYTKAYFTSFHPNSLAILLGYFSISVDDGHNRADLWTEDIYFGHCRQFSISASLELLNVWSVASGELTIVDVLLHTIATENLETVSNLSLEVVDLAWTGKETHFDRALASLRLTSVQHISATLWALQILNCLPDPSHSFPLLTTLKIIYVEHSTYERQANLEATLCQFFSLCQESGNGVTSLDITDYLPKFGKTGWDFLDHIENLKVVYAEAEHVCGGEARIAMWFETLGVAAKSDVDV